MNQAAQSLMFWPVSLLDGGLLRCRPGNNPVDGCRWRLLHSQTDAEEENPEMKSSLGASRMDGSPPLRLHRASPLVVPAGADGAQLLPRARQVRRRRSRSLGSPQHPRRRLILRVSLPRLAVLFCQTHIHAHAQKRVLFLFSFFFFSS